MLLKKYLKKFDETLLKEVSATGAVGTFTGTAGDYIDQKFSGAFHPDFMELKKLLQQQVDGDIAKRLYTDNVTPELEQDFIDLEWDYEYDEEGKAFEMKDIVYDKNEERYNKSDFINDSTTNWKYINNK